MASIHCTELLYGGYFSTPVLEKLPMIANGFSLAVLVKFFLSVSCQWTEFYVFICINDSYC